MKSPTTERSKRTIEHEVSLAALCRTLIGCLLVCAIGSHRDIKAEVGARAPFDGGLAFAGQPIHPHTYDAFGVTPTSAGECWKYAIRIPTTGLYLFSARAAAPADGAKFHVEFDATDVTGPLSVPNSGAWTSWYTVASKCFHLTAGKHVMRVVIDANENGMRSAGCFDAFNVTPIISPSPIHWTAAAPSPEKRFEGYAVAFHGKLFTFGGYNSLIHPYAVNNNASVYDAASNAWKSLGEMPVAPTHAGVAHDTETGVLYFVGGLQGAYPGIATTEVWAYDLNGNTWAPMPPLPIPLAAGAAALIDGDLHYLAGIGAKDRNTNIAAHYVLKLGTTQWRAATPLPTARDHVTVIALDGKIYAFGGEIGHDALHKQQTQSAVYDPATDTWSRLADMPLSKSHTESSVFISEGKIIIAGGQVDQYAATNTILQYNPAANTWSLLGNLPGPLQGAMLQPVGHHLILTNGYDGTHMKTGTWIADWPR